MFNFYSAAERINEQIEYIFKRQGADCVLVYIYHLKKHLGLSQDSFK